MLFISRQIYDEIHEVYGVVDTDDGVEEIVDSGKLAHLIENLNIKIAGVCVSEIPDIFGNIFRSFEYVTAWQSPETTKGAQTKLSMLNGIELTVYKDKLSSISTYYDKDVTDVTIRLSDFCTGLWECVLHLSHQKGCITLVFDDKLSPVPEFAFNKMFPGKVLYDFHEVTNEDLIYSLYEALATSREVVYGTGDDEVDLIHHIIDDEGRTARYIYWCCEPK